MGWNKRTRYSADTAFNCLIDIVGNLPIAKVAKSVVIDFIPQLYEYPANRNRGKNKESIRKIPIHRDLIKIGLSDYILNRERQ